MQYQVGFLDIISSLGTYILIGIISPIILWVAILIKTSQKKTKSRYVLLTLVPSFLLMIIIFSIVVVAQLGCGWTLENDNKLKVKAYVSRNIQLTDMTVDLVDCDEQWQPSCSLTPE